MIEVGGNVQPRRINQKPIHLNVYSASAHLVLEGGVINTV